MTLAGFLFIVFGVLGSLLIVLLFKAPKVGGLLVLGMLGAGGGVYLKILRADDAGVDAQTPIAVGMTDAGQAVFTVGSSRFMLQGETLVASDGQLSYDTRQATTSRTTPPFTGPMIATVTDPKGKSYRFWRENGREYSLQTPLGRYRSDGRLWVEPMTLPHAFGWSRGDLLVATQQKGKTRSTVIQTGETFRVLVIATPSAAHNSFLLWDTDLRASPSPVDALWLVSEALTVTPLPTPPPLPHPVTAKGYSCFSCGCGCYQNQAIFFRDTHAFVLVTGYPITPALRGLYRWPIDGTGTEWEHIIPGNLAPAVYLDPKGCKFAYTLLSKRGDKPKSIDLCTVKP